MTDNAHVSYEVTGQTKQTEPDGNGGYHDVWVVAYRSPSGTRSSVKVPAEFYSAHNVHKLIEHELQTIEHINSLRPGVPAPAPPRAN